MTEKQPVAATTTTIVSPDTDPGNRDTKPSAEHKASPVQREIGGRDGPDPTRYGDWEKAGRCIDF